MADDLRKIFKENLQFYMNDQGKTQADMARHFGISTATASDWYNGNKIPRADKLQSIADWLCIDLSDLLTDPEQRQEKKYYLDDETREYVDFLHKNPEHKVLFDASRKVSKEDINKALKAIGLFIDEK